MRFFLGGYQYYVNPTWHVTDWKKQGEGISMLIKTENTQDVVGLPWLACQVSSSTGKTIAL
ncbi:hypothetical protein FOFC_11410 [Fusarium oxysporum]|nr:hypothetical protein FOFC_11410 [Fusarium oxysporum]